MTTAIDPVIRIRGLCNSFGEQVIHDGLNLDVRAGEVMGVVGGSGTSIGSAPRSLSSN